MRLDKRYNNGHSSLVFIGNILQKRPMGQEPQVSMLFTRLTHRGILFN